MAVYSAESTSYRLAKHDKKHYPHIITSGTEDNPYYTNSSHLPVSFTEDIFEALDIQDELQTLYTSGTVFHAFLGEKLPNWQSAAKLVKTIATNYKLPYFTMSPTYSICPEHGYLTGEQWACPHCGKTTEVYSRITGYYRPIKNWNAGKTQEFKERTEYALNEIKENTENITVKQECAVTTENVKTRPILITTSVCPNCKIVKKKMEDMNFICDIEIADKEPNYALKLGIVSAPTLILLDENDNLIDKFTNVSNIIKYLES